MIDWPTLTRPSTSTSTFTSATLAPSLSLALTIYPPFISFLCLTFVRFATIESVLSLFLMAFPTHFLCLGRRLLQKKKKKSKSKEKMKKKYRPCYGSVRAIILPQRISLMWFFIATSDQLIFSHLLQNLNGIRSIMRKPYTAGRLILIFDHREAFCTRI